MAPSEAGGGGGAPGAAFFTAETVCAGATTASLSMQKNKNYHSVYQSKIQKKDMIVD
jgi:hypothetical protein